MPPSSLTFQRKAKNNMATYSFQRCNRIAKTEATEMSTDTETDREDVVQMYNDILLSHKKE